MKNAFRIAVLQILLLMLVVTQCSSKNTKESDLSPLEKHVYAILREAGIFDKLFDLHFDGMEAKSVFEEVEHYLTSLFHMAFTEPVIQTIAEDMKVLYSKGMTGLDMLKLALYPWDLYAAKKGLGNVENERTHAAMYIKSLLNAIDKFTDLDNGKRSLFILANTAYNLMNLVSDDVSDDAVPLIRDFLSGIEQMIKFKAE